MSLNRQAALVLGLAALVAIVVALTITWNTAYEAGRSDGIVQLGCVQQAQGSTSPTPDCFK
jgi:hypothetical protein